MLVAVVLGETFDLDHLVAEAGAGWDDDLGAADTLALGLVRHLVIGVDPGLLFGLTGLGAGADPVKFACKGALLRFVLLGLMLQPLRLLFEPGRIIALVGHAAAPVQFEDPAGDLVKEIAVVGDDQAGALVVDEVLLEPGDGFGIKVVGRLVEKQHVRGFEEELAKRDAALFAAAEVRNLGVVGRAAQRLHRDVDLGVEIPEVLAVDLILELAHFLGSLIRIVHRQFVVAIEDVLLGLHPQHDVAAHIEAVVKLGFLRQIADMSALGGPSLAGEILVEAGHDPHQRRFTRAVDANDADLDPGKEGKADVFKAFLAAGIGLGDPIHVVDVLVGSHRLPRELSVAAGIAESMEEGNRRIAAARLPVSSGVRKCPAVSETLENAMRKVQKRPMSFRTRGSTSPSKRSETAPS